MIKVVTILLALGFVAGGVAGFIPALSPMHEMNVLLPESSRLVLGLFPVNAVHNAAHIAYGILGFMALRSMAYSIAYNRSVLFIYGVLAVLGLIPATRNLFGLMPIGGNDVGLHFALAIVGLIGGYLTPFPAQDQRRS
jgi:hypothetical protein|tara:strand:- start:4989 stop:5402 length:414 start_codon:yes stop_codon:yes gene_type:complete